MKNTMTKNITIRDIIYSRIDFIENNNIFDKSMERYRRIPRTRSVEQPFYGYRDRSGGIQLAAIRRAAQTLVYSAGERVAV